MYSKIIPIWCCLAGVRTSVYETAIEVCGSQEPQAYVTKHIVIDVCFSGGRIAAFCTPTKLHPTDLSDTLR